VERDTFDRLVRLIGAAGSRRDALRVGAAGILFGGIGALEGSAAKRRGADRNNRTNRTNRNRGRVQTEQVGEIPKVCLTSTRLGCSRGPEARCMGANVRPGANLRNCNFVNESGLLFNVILPGANLAGTCWFAETLDGPTNFSGADLTNACFFEAELGNANFRGAIVRGASFCEADLRGADFRGSNVTAAQLACATVGCDTILPNGNPAVACTGGQTCCGAVCCNPANCEDDTCLESSNP
jgi:uncharacterized protein YjbI with pentapeptide repeats